VCGPKDNVDRKCLWDELVDLVSWWELSWCIEGDFNVVRYSCERLGDFKRSPAMLAFSELIFDQGLMDIPCVGGNFTWSNNCDFQSWSKIDRFLLSLEWKDQFPNVS
jgi:hypothetical protein